MKSKELPQGTLSISKLKNLNQLKASSSTITSLEFHPHSKIAFTTSLNKRLNFFQVFHNLSDARLAGIGIAIAVSIWDCPKILLLILSDYK